MSHWPTCMVGTLCSLSKLFFCHLCAFAMFFSAISLTSSFMRWRRAQLTLEAVGGWISTSCPRPAYHRQINGRSCFPPKHQVEWSKSSAVLFIIQQRLCSVIVSWWLNCGDWQHALRGATVVYLAHVDCHMTPAS